MKDYVGIGRTYAEDVISGAIPACEWVRRACQRQLDDLARQDDPEWPYRFDNAAASRICIFAELMPHIKGRWGTKTITLEPWQIFGFTTIFGWLDKQTGLRRFRKVLEVVPRKNAKTTKASIVGLYCLAFDDEPGAEIYSAATTRDQAKISWDMANKMVRRTPQLQELGLEALATSISLEREGSMFVPLSRDADTLEGKNTHCGIIDELHAHKTREVFDVIDESTGSRRQPLLYIISTEGDNPEGVFAEQVDYCQSVLRGTHQDDTFFGIIYTLDKEDDWTLESSWAKANPNYGVSVFPHDMRARYNQAKMNADSQASFLTKRLNVRVGAGDAYFNLLAWSTICKDETLRLEDFLECPAIVTLDLASKRDLTSRITVFERGGEFYVFGKHYLPSDAIQAGRPNYDIYRGWEASGKIIATEGNRTDYEIVERDLLEHCALVRPQRVGIDPNYNAVQFSQRMMTAGVPVEEVPHNISNFSNPMKTLDALIVAGKVHHDGDPVLTWAIGNTVGKKDGKGNVYPTKSRDVNKIDPAVALIANQSIWMRLEAQDCSFQIEALG